MRLPLTAARLFTREGTIECEPAGDLVDAVLAHIRGQPGKTGLVVLGTFGSGKTQLCIHVAATAGVECTVVPLRDVARSRSAAEGLQRTIGSTRLAEAARGERLLLLDGLDEVPPRPEGHPAFFEELVSLAGPRWLMTSRPGHFRTDLAEPTPDQVDLLDREDVDLLTIDPLSREVARSAIAAVPGGSHLVDSVENLEQLATSPLLLHVVHAALPYIEPGRPIEAWGVFDAWIRHALSTGPSHPEALHALESLGWAAFDARGTMEVPTFSPDELATVPPELRRALMVTDLDGRLRFGHRSVYEFLLASRMAPQIRQNQGHGRDRLSGVLITEAVRVFIVGRTGPMPVVVDGERVRIPRGNFVAGGDFSPDERDLRIEHIDRGFWISRTPVTNAEYAAHADDRVDAHYLRHWGVDRKLPKGQEELPVYHIWPEDADRYAAAVGARLPTADEWEKAARGIDGRRWPWGDQWRPGKAVTADLGVERPLPVRAFGAHGDAALFGTAGGVFEYTASPWRGRANRGRIVMGGCYTHPSPISRTSLRLSHKVSGNLKAGIRLAWDCEGR